MVMIWKKKKKKKNQTNEKRIFFTFEGIHYPLLSLDLFCYFRKLALITPNSKWICYISILQETTISESLTFTSSIYRILTVKKFFPCEIFNDKAMQSDRTCVLWQIQLKVKYQVTCTFLILWCIRLLFRKNINTPGTFSKIYTYLIWWQVKRKP